MARLEDLANKGHRNLERRVLGMARTYDIQRETAIRRYCAQPFGPTRCESYTTAMRSFTRPAYESKPTDLSKWRRNWLRAMQE